MTENVPKKETAADSVDFEAFFVKGIPTKTSLKVAILQPLKAGKSYNIKTGNVVTDCTVTGGQLTVKIAGQQDKDYLRILRKGEKFILPANTEFILTPIGEPVFLNCFHHSVEKPGYLPVAEVELDQWSEPVKKEIIIILDQQDNKNPKPPNLNLN